MKMFDFSDFTTKKFQYQGQYYRIFHSIRQGIGWLVKRYPSMWDYARPWGAPEQCLGPTFTDPNELIRTITIDNHTLEEIINSLPEPDPSQSPFFEYNYERFLIDTFNRMEFGFYFRENHYYIDYWDSNDKDPNWVPGWIFIAGYGSSEVLITDDSFDAFIDKVDLWMIDNEGKTLKEMFNNLYKPDGTGDVKLLSIYI